MNHTSYKKHGPSVSQKHLIFFMLRTEFPILTSQLLNPVFWSCFYPAPVLTFHDEKGMSDFHSIQPLATTHLSCWLFNWAKAEGMFRVLPPRSLWHYSAMHLRLNAAEPSVPVFRCCILISYVMLKFPFYSVLGSMPSLSYITYVSSLSLLHLLIYLNTWQSVVLKIGCTLESFRKL